MFLIVFNLLECSNHSSVKWKHDSLDMQEFYQYKETSPIPVDSQIISSFLYMNWNLNLEVNN